ncbi:MAG: alanine--tRNA ligase, partial [Clostridia bacterium]|nr:alanine--tRNA ligase [Clostridia bacterium]
DASKNLLEGLPQTTFTGYTDYRTAGCKVIAILAEDQLVQEVSEGDCTVVLDKTPFYGEGGGQVGDTGNIYKDENLLTVYDTRKTDGVYLHLCTVVGGSIKVGDEVTADITDTRRDAIRRNHSACHLLQAALRSVLGTHVEQAGSYVDNKRCRFDFTHFQGLTAEELAKVEALVNLNILAGNAIETRVTDIETAKAEGAMALFGEKYGSEVRMVKMGDFSTELCGGTHCDNTAKIGLFKILTESSVAAGVRRIEAVTGVGVLELLAEKDNTIHETAKVLKAQNPHEVANRAAAVMAELSAARKEIESLNARMAASKLDDILKNAVDVGAVKLIAGDLGSTALDSARGLCDTLRDKYSNVVAVFALQQGDKLNFVAACGKDAITAGAHAGNLLKAVSAVTGGKGGGRPDSATSGGKDIAKVAEALAQAKDILAGMLK